MRFLSGLFINPWHRLPLTRAAHFHSKQRSIMNTKKFFLAFLVAGVAMNVVDGLLYGVILRNMFTSIPIMRQDAPTAWFIALDFVSVLVLLSAYIKVKGSFAPGVGGAALFGCYAGVLVSFPMLFSMKLVIKDFPYYLAWFWTIAGIVWYIIAGVLIGVIYKEKPGTA
jgi:hypothetical protein